MYVCVCNALNERAVHEARCEGASSANDVHRHHGTKPQCGKCTKMMSDMVNPGNAPAAGRDAARPAGT